MTDAELEEMRLRAGVSESHSCDNWKQCPHGRPFERCEACGGEDVFALVAEVRRLRALVKEAEERGCKCGAYTEPSGCPWCVGEQRPGTESTSHTADCPAFHESGEVR